MTWDYDNPLTVADELGESAKQNALLVAYYEMGLDRSLPRLAAKLERKPAYVQYLNQLSTQYGWWDRVKRAQELETAARQLAERDLWLVRRAEMRDSLHGLAEKLTTRASEMLDAALYSDKVIRERAIIRDGERVIEQTIIRQPAKWSAADAAKFGTVAGQLAKLATGLSESPSVNLNFSPDDLGTMSDDELAAAIERLKQAN